VQAIGREVVTRRLPAFLGLPLCVRSQYPPCPVNDSLIPRLGSIAIANITAVGGPGSIGAAGDFHGLGSTAESGGITNVTLRDVDLGGAAAAGWSCANVSGSSSGVVLPAPCPQLAGGVRKRNRALRAHQS
jgi:hypothetical protein